MVDPRKKPRVIGQLQRHPDGYGFLLPEDPTLEDIFIPPTGLGDARHRDRVEVELSVRSRRPGNRRDRTRPGPDQREGRVVQVLARGVERVVGRSIQIAPIGLVAPDDDRLPSPIHIPLQALGGARPGDTVVVEWTETPAGQSGVWGAVRKILGPRGEIATEIEAVLHHHGLPEAFPTAVLRAAEDVANAYSGDEWSTDRQDRTQVPFVTIDGESARDFDDAVAVEPLPDGASRISVGIADVSAFVTPGSPLDEEAAARGTSVYFPDRVLPMLPPVLSDDLCSLRPDIPRCALVVEYRIAPDGALGSPRFSRAWIRSRARLTYTQVQRILNAHAAPAPKARTPAAVSGQIDPQLERMLLQMAVLCRTLREVRLARGSIDFDLPEPEILLDIEGSPERILKAERFFAHQMIEELMIATNEQVARTLTRRGAGCLYRIHPPPKAETLRDLRLLLDHLDIPHHLTTTIRSKDLAQVIATVRGHAEERLVNHTILRAMQQAVYRIDNVGHFGLASPCYCHFTSPIRRYPDLVIHRLVVQTLLERGSRQRHADREPDRLRRSALHSSRRERIALEAEREMLKVYATAFLRERIGAAFSGRITRVTKFGCFVELDDFFVEGLILRESLPFDQFRFDDDRLRLVGRRTGRTLAMGDPVHVKVERVDIPARQAHFVLIE
ncbi:MAG: ribonuclease R [Deltaproteobacteria bacterium]|nr:ribonuclease R [Deltaproteobacteria bacterium]